MKKFELNFLNIAIFICFIFLAIVISPFLSTLVLAAILVTGTMPLHDWVLRKVRRKRLAAFIMALASGIVFSVVFFVFFTLLAQEAVSTYSGFERWLREGNLNVNELIAKASASLGIRPTDIITSISQAAQSASTAVVTQSTNLLKSLAWLLINLMLLVLTMFFFYKDGKAIVEFMEKIIPLPRPYAHEILDRFKQVSRAMLYGIFLTAIIQGFLGGVGFAVAGIGNPIFWGTLMGFAGMLPIAGTAIIWLPASLFLLADGRYVAGIGLLLWGALIVALVDNVVKPIIISQQTRINALVTFLVVIGGLLVFSLKGAIIAPMVLAGFFTLMHIRKEMTGEKAVV